MVQMKNLIVMWNEIITECLNIYKNNLSKFYIIILFINNFIMIVIIFSLTFILKIIIIYLITFFSLSLNRILSVVHRYNIY